jgi:hypothetical protein
MKYSQKSPAIGSKSVFPSLCPHCATYVSKPPAWIFVFDLMRKRKKMGLGREGAWITSAIVARDLGIPESKAGGLMFRARQDKVLEPIKPGSNIYMKSRYGMHLDYMWGKAGWKGSHHGKTQQEMRTKIGRRIPRAMTPSLEEAP